MVHSGMSLPEVSGSCVTGFVQSEAGFATQILLLEYWCSCLETGIFSSSGIPLGGRDISH